MDVGHHISMVNLLGRIPLKKIASLFPSSHQMWTASHLGIGPCIPLPHPCWNVDWLNLVQILCRHQSFCEIRSATVLSYPEDTVFLWSSQPLAHSVFLPPLQRYALNLWRRECCMNFPFVLEYSIDNYSLQIASLYKQPSTPQRHWWELRVALIYGHRDMNLESSLILYPFSKTIVVGLPLGSMNPLPTTATGSWPD